MQKPMDVLMMFLNRVSIFAGDERNDCSCETGMEAKTQGDLIQKI